jgi:hypothetical protein
MNDINYESRFFIFSKIFYRDQLIKIFEENCDKASNGVFSNYLPTSMLNISFDSYSVNNPIFEQNAKVLEKYGLHHTDFRKVNEFLADTYDACKISFRNLKINKSICEKILENYKYQFQSLECIYKNVSALFE